MTALQTNYVCAVRLKENLTNDKIKLIRKCKMSMCFSSLTLININKPKQGSFLNLTEKQAQERIYLTRNKD